MAGTTTSRTLRAARVLDGAGGQTAGPAWVTVAEGRIVATGVGEPADPVEDLGDAFLAPGFLDLQVNGHGACDFATASSSKIIAAVDDLARSGVTGLLVTVCSAPLEAYDAVLERIREAQEQRPGTIIGVHLEGPFLGGAPGAHPAAVVRHVDPAFVRHICSHHADLVRLVTLAPEADPGHGAIRAFSSAGIRIALGHSTASYEEVLDAVGAGATVATHLFNGMAPLHHRAPGLVGAALTEPALVPTVIADFVHVHPAIVGLALAARPDAPIVSDAVAADATRLADGTLAGSDVSMARIPAHLGSIGIPPARAVRHLAGNPARVLGIPDRGRIAPGGRADLVAIDPTSGAVRRVADAG